MLGDIIATKMNEKRAGAPPKYSQKHFLDKPRVTKKIKAKILRAYEKWLQNGKGREDVLIKLAREYKKSEREIERYIHSARQDKDEREKAATLKEDPLIIEAKRKHFEALYELIRNWKEELVFDVSGPLERYEITFPYAFRSEDNRGAGLYKKGPLCWCVKDDGDVDVRFEVEKASLFRCLRPHLPSESLWQSFEQLKQELAEGIKQAASSQNRKSTFVRKSYELVYKIVTELDIALDRKGVFPGKCEACPEQVL